MAMHDKSELKSRRPEIDLTGPEGNVFVLMGYAKRWAKDLGLDGNAIVEDLGLDGNAIVTDMKSSNYDHALEVLEEHFGEYVDFYR